MAYSEVKNSIIFHKNFRNIFEVAEDWKIRIFRKFQKYHVKFEFLFSRKNCSDSNSDSNIQFLVRENVKVLKRRFFSQKIGIDMKMIESRITSETCHWSLVNFINDKRTNFLYEHHVLAAFSSYMYVEKWRSYEKFVCKMLIKLTTGLLLTVIYKTYFLKKLVIL